MLHMKRLIKKAPPLSHQNTSASFYMDLQSTKQLHTGSGYAFLNLCTHLTLIFRVHYWIKVFRILLLHIKIHS